MLPATVTVASVLADAADVVTAFAPAIVLAVGIGLGIRFVPRIVGMAKGGKR